MDATWAVRIVEARLLVTTTDNPEAESVYVEVPANELQAIIKERAELLEEVTSLNDMVALRDDLVNSLQKELDNRASMIMPSASCFTPGTILYQNADGTVGPREATTTAQKVKAP